jgi:hypothetical protein
VSVLGELIDALRRAITLADDVKHAAETLKDVARELRDHDRRITRLEAKWEAAVELSGGRGWEPRRLGDNS